MNNDESAVTEEMADIGTYAGGTNVARAAIYVRQNHEWVGRSLAMYC